MTPNSSKMRAARLHAAGQPFLIEDLEIPKPRSGDVVVRVRACSVVPNMKAVISGRYWHTLPNLPAVYGLDAAGVVCEIGAEVNGWQAGDRVYVNPILFCGSCEYCRRDAPLLCTSLALRGYFGYAAPARALLDRYPYGGFCEYITASASSLVRLPANVSSEHGARFGYLGTAFAALLAAGAKPGCSVLVNGGTGTLGVGAVVAALALGAISVSATGRNRELLKRLEQIAPGRVTAIGLDELPAITEKVVADSASGFDITLDCLGRGAPPESTVMAIKTLKRGGCAVNIGALSDVVRIEPTWFMLNQISYRGSNWFTTAQAQQMADLAQAGLLDLSVFENTIFSLDRVNDAIELAASRPGGFANVVVAP